MQLMESLPTKDAKAPGELFVINTLDPAEKNICTKDAVAKARAKNWIILDDANGANDNNGKPYEGSETALLSTMQPSLTLAPNPVRETLYVQGTTTQSCVAFYSLEGILLRSTQSDAEGYASLDVADLPAGGYVVKIDGMDYKLVVE